MHLYRHYKGGWYLTLTEHGIEESTGKRLVHYFSPWKLLRLKFQLWTRYPDNFFEMVTIDHREVPRFKKLL